MPDFPLLLETIKIENGHAFNLPYHQRRVHRSRQELFGAEDILELSSLISPPSRGLYRCRIIYARTFQSIEYIPYLPKKIQRLRVVPSSLDYCYKYADREALNNLLKKNSDVDEVIIEKKGLLTDTTISNIAFFDGETWFTPRTPLLYGTMRARLIDKGLLQTKDITKKSLPEYSHVALINAMLGFMVLKDLRTSPIQI